MASPEDLQAIIHFGAMAADHELLNNPAPQSTVLRPGGGAQFETMAERTHRIVAAAVSALVSAGLLQVPAGAAGPAVPLTSLTAGPGWRT
jgi:hypothetical protein